MFGRFFRRRKERREMDTVRRAFGQYLSTETVEKIISAPETMEPSSLREGEIGYVLAWLRGDGPEAVSRRLGRAAELAESFGGVTDSMISGLIVIGFGLLPLPEQAQDRVGLAAALSREFGPNLKLVHGSGWGHIGSLGGPTRMSHSFILPEFEVALAGLCALEFGQVREFRPTTLK